MVFREVAPTEAVPMNNQSNVPKKSQEEEVHELLEGMSKVNPKQNFLKEQ